MTLSFAFALGTLALFGGGAAAAGEPATTCAPGAQGGIVQAVTGAPARRSQADRPFIDRIPRSRLVARGDALCKNDLLTNPASSGETVRYRLTGRRPVDMPPGNSLQIPAPSRFSGLVDLIAEFDSNFGAADGQAGGGTRGSGQWRAITPLPSRLAVSPALGPLILAWPEGVVAEVTLATGADRRTASLSVPTKLDIAKSCPKGCTLTISTVQGVSRSSDIVVMAASEVPMPPNQSAVKLGADGRFLVGAWLADIQADAAWRLQGASLLWSAACVYPAIDPAVTALYRLPNPPDVCATLPTF